MVREGEEKGGREERQREGEKEKVRRREGRKER